MSNKPFNDPMTLEELTARAIELTEKVARLEAIAEEFGKTREELKAEMRELREEVRRLDAKIEKVRDELREEIRELRTYMIGGFIAVIAVSVLLKILLG
jgi:molecular chaperone GrpE (heat shock protein)